METEGIAQISLDSSYLKPVLPIGTVWLYNQPSRSTQPSTLCGMVKWLSASGLSNNGGDGGCSFIAA